MIAPHQRYGPVTGLVGAALGQAQQLVRRAGLTVTLFTSGSMLTTEKVQALASFVCWFALSLDITRETVPGGLAC